VGIDSIDNLAVPAARSKPYFTRRLLRGAIHFLSYKFILSRRSVRISRAGGFRLIVRPTVFHPRYFIASEYFSSLVAEIDLTGLRVADIGTGTGIIALTAARAGARMVLAIDINPNAALSARENAAENGLSDRVSAICGDLLSALAPSTQFDVILANPPIFAKEPLDLADRAWHAGPGYRDIAALFEQARAHLAPGGRFYIMLSSDSDLDLMNQLIAQARFRARVVAKRSLVIESLIMFELRAD
jgi:methylase of polypeptide subunit release factors